METKNKVIVSGADFVSDVLAEHFAGGHVAVFGDTAVAGIVATVKRRLFEKGYFVKDTLLKADALFSHKLAELKKLPEYIKFFIGVGGGEAAELAKIAAREFGAKCAVIVTAPTSDSIFVASTRKGLCLPPVFALVDKPSVLNAPSRLVAVGTGLVYSSWITYLDLKFDEFVQGKTRQVTDKLFKILTDFEAARTADNCNMLLLETIFKLAKIRPEYGMTGAQEVMGRLLMQSTDLYLGEAAFISAYIIAHLYRAYLENGAAADTLIPPDNIKSRKILQKKYGIDYLSGLKKVDIFSNKSYFKHSYIVSEYRTDLLEIVGSVDMREKQRHFRRSYDDAGFWLKEKLYTKELLRALSLAGEIAENTFLKHIKDVGFLEQYL